MIATITTHQHTATVTQPTPAPVLRMLYRLRDGRPVYEAPTPTWDAANKQIHGTQPVRWLHRLGWQVQHEEV